MENTSVNTDQKIPFNIPKHIVDELLSSNRIKHEENKHLFSSSEIETVNFKELDEEINFFPLSEGLGFNQKEEVKTQATLEAKKSKTNSFVNQNLSIKKELDNNRIDRADLSPFYSETKITKETHPLFTNISLGNLDSYKSEIKEKQVEPTLTLEEKVYYSEPTTQDKVLAMAIDLVFICSLLSITVYATLSLLGYYNPINWNWLKTSETLTYLMPFFVIYYLLYFTLMEREGNSTLGKQILNLKVISTNNNPVDFNHSFLRALITLSSSLAFGLPLVLDFQGKLSDTKVVKL